MSWVQGLPEVAMRFQRGHSAWSWAGFLGELGLSSFNCVPWVDAGLPKPLAPRVLLEQRPSWGMCLPPPCQSYKSIWAQVRMLPASGADKRKLGGAK